MNNSLLFNNIHYNKIIKKKNIFDHPNKNLFINIFILLFFIIILGLFLSYRYNCKQNIIKEQEKIKQNDNILEENNKNILEEKNEIKNEINIENKKNISLDKISVKTDILLDIQNNNFSTNLDEEDSQYHLI